MTVNHIVLNETKAHTLTCFQWYNRYPEKGA